MCHGCARTQVPVLPTSLRSGNNYNPIYRAAFSHQVCMCLIPRLLCFRSSLVPRLLCFRSSLISRPDPKLFGAGNEASSGRTKQAGVEDRARDSPFVEAFGTEIKRES